MGCVLGFQWVVFLGQENTPKSNLCAKIQIARSQKRSKAIAGVHSLLSKIGLEMTAGRTREKMPFESWRYAWKLRRTTASGIVFACCSACFLMSSSSSTVNVQDERWMRAYRCGWIYESLYKTIHGNKALICTKQWPNTSHIRIFL